MNRFALRKSLPLLLFIMVSAAASENHSSQQCVSLLNDALDELVNCKLGTEAIRRKGESTAVIERHDRNCETRFIKKDNSILARYDFCHLSDTRKYLDDALETVRTEVGRISAIQRRYSPTVIASQPNLKVMIVNNLPVQSACTNGNSLSVFTPDGPPNGQLVPPGGGSLVIDDQLTSAPGAGIQINNWYWTRDAYPVQQSTPQNPDNSGAQFWFSDQTCSQLMQSNAWSGDGIQTYRVSAVTGSNQAGCTITIEANDYTASVTPSCCSFTTCAQGSWGKTNNGKPWPPTPPSDLLGRIK